MNDGIEKLQKYAFGMNPRRCDDILVLADQIQREHVSELQALEERYHTDLQNAREARDIAIKEASKLRNDVNLAKDLVHDLRSDIAIMLGISCDGMADDVYDAIKAELDKRLMPPCMEWPRFEDGKQITWDDAPEDIAAVCLALDGSCYALHYDMPDDERMCIYEVSERVKRPEPDVLAADGLPIKLGETLYRTSGGYPVVVDEVDGYYVKTDCGGYLACDSATHAQQDSWDRLFDDVQRTGHAPHTNDEWIKRAKALSERGA